MIRNKKKFIAVLLLMLIISMALAVPASAFGVGARGPDVYVVQGMLKDMGYYSGKIDGVYGNLTAQGVKYFQQKYGLPVTGAVDEKTFKSIMWAYENGKFPKAPPAPSKPAPTPSKAGLSPEEQQLFDLVNQERTKRGIPALKVDPALAHTARLKSQDMVNKNYFSHQSPTYGSPFQMMKKFGISFTTAGENIACNQSVQAAHQALMNSPGHRANILNPNFQYIGVGIVNGGMCGKMFTEQFVGR